jgi:protein dithiol oxidoreductase (disulfide-forming)
MRWLAVLAATVALVACGSRESPNPNDSQVDSQGVTSSGSQSNTSALTKQSGTTSSSASSTDASADPGETDPATIAAASESGDEITDAEKSTTLETLKLASLSAGKAISGFKEGVNYRRLVPVQPSGAAAGAVHIVEFFSYSCQPCFEIDAKLDAWRSKHKLAYVTFERIPVSDDSLRQLQARAFYTAEQLETLDKLHPLLFSEIQAGKVIDNAAALSKFFAAQNIERKAIDAALKSQDVDAKLARASNLQRRYRVDALPYFVINGKFVTTLELAGDDERLFALINQLAIREHEF